MVTMSNNKLNGIMKGLRFIYQIFDNDKEPEMQIGHPTDVKHVAHIGWEGTSAASTLMNPTPEATTIIEDTSLNSSTSHDSGRRGGATSGHSLPSSPAKDTQKRKKSSRHSTGSSSLNSYVLEKSSDKTKPTRPSKSITSNGSELPLKPLDAPHRRRRNKSNDSTGGSLSSRKKGQPLVMEPGLGSESPSGSKVCSGELCSNTSLS